MCVPSETFIDAHSRKIGGIRLYGQKANHTKWQRAKMNHAIRGIEGNLGKEYADTFHVNFTFDFKMNFILAKSLFTIEKWVKAPVR